MGANGETMLKLILYKHSTRMWIDSATVNHSVHAGEAIPVQGLDRPRRSSDSRHMKVEKLSALSTGPRATDLVHMER